MPEPLKVLIAEDNRSDAGVLLRELRRAGFEPEWRLVDNEKDYMAHLHSGFDLVLSDYAMPQFSGLRALELLNQSGLEIPLIIVSGAIGEDTAVAAMKDGAADYLLKDRLGRLGSAVSHALNQSQLRRERKRANERYRALAARLETIREQERTNMAREIHDILSQDLTRLKIDLVWLAKRLGRPNDEALRPEMVARIGDAVAQTDSAITTVQRIATELRPVILDSLGLPAAVEWLAEDFTRRTGIVATARALGGETSLDRSRATALFRILQESLTNIIRHAQATAVDIQLTEDDSAVTLIVRDNGCGISAAQLADPRAIGLLGMRERADAFGGTFNIHGTPNAGTIITISMPTSGTNRSDSP